MTKTIRAAVAAIALATAIAPNPALAARSAVSFELFESTLSPHGSWHDSAGLGRVWRPNVDVIGWHPYTHGRWLYTEFGWTWVPDYDWGAIPYHYGTWAIDSALGWVWVPGTVWAPSWVVFRSGPSYVGWAPVPPSFTIGAASGLSDYSAEHFVFVRKRDFLASRIREHAVPEARARAVYEDTVVVGSLAIEDGVIVNRGIDPRRAERFADARLERRPIEEVPRIAPAAAGPVTRDALRISESASRPVRVVSPADSERAPRAPSG